MLRRLIIGGFLSLVAALGVTTAVAMPAGAATPGCTHGAFAGYCGTQTDQETTPMSWDVFRQAVKVGQPLIAFPNSDTDKALDFVALHPGASSVGAAKMFIYAPDGKVSNLCVSEPDQGAALVLRVCNGSAWQVFTAKQVDGTKAYEWANSGCLSAAGRARPVASGWTMPPAGGCQLKRRLRGIRFAPRRCRVWPGQLPCPPARH